MIKNFSVGSLFLVTGTLLLASAVIDRSPPVRLEVIHAVSNVEPGHDLPVRIELDRLRHCDTEVQMTVYDSRGTRFPAGEESYSIVGPIGQDTYITLVPIDEDATPGQGRVRYGLRWVCNYTHIIWPIKEFYDVDIEIVPRSEKLY